MNVMTEDKRAPAIYMMSRVYICQLPILPTCLGLFFLHGIVLNDSIYSFVCFIFFVPIGITQDAVMMDPIAINRPTNAPFIIIYIS